MIDSAQPPAADSELYCPGCGYDLRAIESDRCPECGVVVDRSTLGTSVIPWLHRARLGRYRAFWRTVRMATFRPRELAREISRPAHFRDAVLFRRLAVLHAFVPIGLLVGGVYVYGLHESPGGIWTYQDPLGSAVQLLMIPVFWICLWLFLLAVSGVAGYFFHPKSIPIVQQNRAIAISYYGCAPLAYSPVSVLLLVGGAVLGSLLVDSRGAGILVGLAWLIAWAPLGIQIASMIRVPVVLLKSTTHCTGARQWAMTAFLFVFWLVVGLLLLVVVPGAVGSIGLIVIALHEARAG